MREDLGVYIHSWTKSQKICAVYGDIELAEDIVSKRFAIYKRRNLDLEVKDHTSRTAQVDDDQTETIFNSTVGRTAWGITEIFHLSHLIC